MGCQAISPKALQLKQQADQPVHRSSLIGTWCHEHIKDPRSKNGLNAVTRSNRDVRSFRRAGLGLWNPSHGCYLKCLPW